MGADEEARKRLAAQTACPTSLAKRTLRRHTPKVGAVCPNRARTVLCGGRSVMGVPTATERSDTHQLHFMKTMGFAGSTHPSAAKLAAIPAGASPADRGVQSMS